MYTLRDADEGACRCGTELKLLTHKEMPDGYPAFLICFSCQGVTEVKGDDGETVEYKRGRRKKHTKTAKRDRPDAKKDRLRDHQARRQGRTPEG